MHRIIPHVFINFIGMQPWVYASRIHNNIWLIPAISDHFEKPLARTCLAQINHKDATIARAEHLFQFLLTAANQQNAGTLIGKRLCHKAANATATASDKRSFTRNRKQIFRHTSQDFPPENISANAHRRHVHDLPCPQDAKYAPLPARPHGWLHASCAGW